MFPCCLLIPIPYLIGCVLVAGENEAPRDPGENAALQYWAGAHAFAGFGDDAWRAQIDEAIGAYSRGNRPVWAGMMEPCPEAIHFLKEGAERPYLDWGNRIDRDGPAAPMGQLGPMRELARLTQFHAWWAVEEGLPGVAVDDLVALVRMGRQWTHSPTLIDLLVAISIEHIGLAGMGHLAPRLPAEERRRLVRELTSVPPPAPLDRAMVGERAILAWMRKRVTVEHLRQLNEAKGRLDRLKKVVDPKVVPILEMFRPMYKQMKIEEGLTPELLSSWFDEIEQLHDASAELLVAPDKDYPALLKAFEQRWEAANPLLAMLMSPSVVLNMRENHQMRNDLVRLLVAVYGLPVIDGTSLAEVQVEGLRLAVRDAGDAGEGAWIIDWGPADNRERTLELAVGRGP